MTAHRQHRFLENVLIIVTDLQGCDCRFPKEAQILLGWKKISHNGKFKHKGEMTNHEMPLVQYRFRRDQPVCKYNVSMNMSI